MALLHVFGQEVIRIELFGVFTPDVWTPMQSVKINQQSDAGWYLVIICVADKQSFD